MAFRAEEQTNALHTAQTAVNAAGGSGVSVRGCIGVELEPRLPDLSPGHSRISGNVVVVGTKTGPAKAEPVLKA